jgi:dTDP-4-amino-4,6-dideoxygalactose transaminase
LRGCERLAQRPPAISSIPSRALLRAAREANPAERLRRELARRLGAKEVALHASGRAALRAALLQAARATGRSEVLIPAYTCFSVPAACVAAGLRVRLLDLDERGGIDPEQISQADWERAAACLVDNLFGLPAPVAPLRARTHASGAWLIDDAAQALGATSAEGAVGTRGELGLLSFGRGKPLSGLGGGALVFTRARPQAVPPLPSRAPLRAWLRWAGYALASRPPLFGLLAAIPPLGIGESIYDPDFATGGISAPAALLAAAALEDVDAATERRRAAAHELAARIARAGSGFVPLLEAPGARGVYPRLAVLAPDGARRDAALGALRRLGATAMYPTPLSAIAALRPHLVGEIRTPGAQRFCERLLTLPTYGSGWPERIAEALVRAPAS